MIEVYMHGCSCGVNGLYVRKVKRYARANNLDVRVYNTKYGRLDRHVELLEQLGLGLDQYIPIVLYNGEVKELLKWSS